MYRRKRVRSRAESKEMECGWTPDEASMMLDDYVTIFGRSPTIQLRRFTEQSNDEFRFEDLANDTCSLSSTEAFVPSTLSCTLPRHIDW